MDQWSISKRARLSLSLAFAVLLTTSAVAQDKPRRFEIFLQGGGSFFNEKKGPGVASVLDPVSNTVQFVPTTEVSSLRQTGRLFVGIRYFFTPSDAMEGSFSYSPSDLFQRRLQPVLPLPDFTSQMQVLDIYSYNYVRYLRKKGRIRPFVTGGVGLAYFLNASATGHRVAWNFGGGADVHLSPRIAVRMEYRDFIMDIPEINPGLSPTGKIHNQVPSVGLVFRF
jgi:opacity protein-like surface antigen